MADNFVRAEEKGEISNIFLREEATDFSGVLNIISEGVKWNSAHKYKEWNELCSFFLWYLKKKRLTKFCCLSEHLVIRDITTY